MTIDALKRASLDHLKDCSAASFMEKLEDGLWLCVGTKESIARLVGAELAPEPIIRNIKAPSDLKVGDYVYASRWTDCDPGDPWIVGHVVEISPLNVYVRNETMARWFPCAMRITAEQGARICAQFPLMEHLPQDYQAIARVFSPAPLATPPQAKEE